ncbi:NERD domain-containing protein, partial [Pseudoxanthomonas sp. SGD-10]
YRMRIYNTIGSLTALKLHLEENNIYDFKSLREVIDFKSSFENLKQLLISHHRNLIENEKSLLDVELKDLDIEIKIKRQHTEQILTEEIEKLRQQLNNYINYSPTNLFHKITRILKIQKYTNKIKNKEKNFINNVNKMVKPLSDIYVEKSKRHQFITSNVDEAVKQSAHHSLLELERKKTVVDNLNNFIYGALGEQKVVKILKHLPDEYILINDFSVSFSPAIYNRQEDDYIRSVQIDHILVAPSGIFLIETKNWSEKSLENLSLRSPVEQIRRTSFVLFKLLNNEMSNYYLHLDKHHWGDKKISIKNLIVMTKTKPHGEFQYVKVLTLNELIGYINYFKPTFSNKETERIADFILRINEQRTIEM